VLLAASFASGLCGNRAANSLEDNIQAVGRFHKPNVLDDIVMLSIVSIWLQLELGLCRLCTHIEILK